MEFWLSKKGPKFKVKAYHQEEFKDLTHEDLLGNWSILFFYPADFSFLCPQELEELAELEEEFKKEGVEIFSVSADTHYTHKAFHQSSPGMKKINFPMLSDPAGRLSRYFGVLAEEQGISIRGTFLLDPLGHVRMAEINDHGVGRNAKELLRKTQATIYASSHPDKSCPSHWQAGEESEVRSDWDFNEEVYEAEEEVPALEPLR